MMQISTQIPKKDPPIGGQILKLLGVWEVKPRPPPRMAKTQPLFTEPHIDYSARPGATQFFVVACDYALFQT